MIHGWLQIKRDPALRRILIQKKRGDSLCDAPVYHINEIAHTLLTLKRVFRVELRYSSSQLISWFARDPFCYTR